MYDSYTVMSVMFYVRTFNLTVVKSPTRLKFSVWNPKQAVKMQIMSLSVIRTLFYV